MSSLWMFCTVFLSFDSMRLQLVMAEKKEIKEDNTEHWSEGRGFSGNAEPWSPQNNEMEIFTRVNTKGGVGTSWFVTPELKLPNTSYLSIDASCDKTPCQLETFGQFNSLTDKSTIPEFIQNVTFNESRSIKIATIKKSYPYLRILARATSETKFTIYSIEIYYYFCKEGTRYNAVFNNVSSSTTNVSVTVQCTDNSVSSDGKSKNITAKCTPKGNWTFGSQKCVCNKGFHSGKRECLHCPIDHYKITAGDKECQKCPDGKTNNTMHTACECKENRYVGDDKDGPCYGVPSKVKQLRTKVLNETSISITWKEPEDDGGFNGSITYSVEVYRCRSTCNAIVNNAEFTPGNTNLNTTYVIVSSLVFKQEYKIKVISMSNLKNVSSEDWKYTEQKFVLKIDSSTTKAPGTSEQNKNEEKGDNNIFIYVGAAIGFVVILVFIILILIIRHRRGKLKKDGKDNPGFENIPLGQRIYVDPSAYDDPEAALKDFANEISEKNLNLERVIGGGEFGDVYKGILKTEDRGDVEVAVKTLKFDSDDRSRKDFFLEGSAMGQFDDPNVIHLEGVITKSIPHMIVIEYMSNGSLDNFLKQNDGEFTELQLVGMARGVASGMKYLAAMNFIHRDLAARNILVNEGMLCKVADFGLSRELENADESSPGEYCASGGKIPVRWTAPEAMNYRKFSTASDVWSYGILLWEIMSFAERPYWDWDNFKVLERVDEGYRLPAPKNCPKAVHDLMLLCWETNRENRPKFAAIVSMLDDWIRSPETIRYEKPSKRPVSSGSVNDPAMLIKEWLHDIKMGSYIPHFTQAGFTQLSDLAGLQDNDLQVIGVGLIGHRNKMLRTIRSLPITEETKKTPWNRATSLKV